MSSLNGYRIFFFSLIFSAGLAYALVPHKDVTRYLVNLEPAAGDNTAIVAHKVIYELKLASVQTGTSISGVRGQMYYEQDDVCDAWTTDHRFTIRYHYPGQQTLGTTSHFVAYESKDQKQFSFSSERKEDGEMAEQLRGAIEGAEGGLMQVIYSRPGGLKFNLPRGYLLPIAHNMEIIRRAQAGERFFSATLFDGSEADGPVEVGAFIGKKATAEELKKLVGKKDKIDISLLPPEAWHVRMAVFHLKEAQESMPSYEMEIILHSNGVISYALVDYRTHVIEQNLTALEKLPAKKCG